jgi:hypothetical protein
MISEQELEYKVKQDDILKEIYEKGSVDENPHSNIVIKYFGNKSQIPLNDPQKKWNDQEKDENNLLNPQDPRNFLLFIKYKNIYIGAISIDDIFKRENFGLNIYSEDSFYVGNWKANMKEGIGFLKINKNLMYVGNFKNNQMHEFGILYDKENNSLFFGDFDHGDYKEGIVYNYVNEWFYRGKLENGKKNDHLCTYFDAKSGNLFIGEIINDEFNKGYIGFCNITQVKNEDENEEEELLNFNIQKIFYFDGLGANNKSFIHHDAFTPEFYSKIQDIMNNIFQADYNLKDQNESVLEYFSYLEGIESNEDYNTALENYNSFDNAEQCIENEFISNYDNYFQRYKKGQQKLGLAENEKFLEQPDTNEEFEKNAFQNNL